MSDREAWTTAPFKKKGFVSVNALVCMIGVIVGVTVLYVAISSVMDSFHKKLLDKVLGLNGHVIVRPIARPFTDYTETADRLNAVPGVKAVLPVVEGPVLASSQSTSAGIIVRGLRAKDLGALKSISEHIRYGTLEGFDEPGGIAIGTRLANALNVFVGNEITLLAPRGASTPFGTPPRQKRFKIKAIFEMGMSEYDGKFAFLPLREAQSFFNIPDAVHVLELFVDDPDEVDAMRASLQDAAGRDMVLNDWRQRNATFFNTLKAEENVLLSLLARLVANIFHAL